MKHRTAPTRAIATLPPPRSRRPRLRSGPGVVAASAFAMLAWTWGTWPDPVVDFGKEVYIAWQLSQGKRLYADVAYHLGPLSPYFNALAFKLLGPTLATIEQVNLIVAALLLVLMYRLIQRIAGVVAAAAAGVVFSALFAFTHFTVVTDYNFVCPYDHAHTHGLLLGLAALAAMDLYRRSGKRWALVLCGMCVGLAFLTRAELFVAAAVGVAATWAAGWLARSTVERPFPAPKAALMTGAIAFLGGAVIPVLLAFALLALRLPLRVALRGIEGSWPSVFDRSVVAMPFYKDSMGTLDPHESLLRLAKWTAAWAALIGVALVLSFWWRARSRPLLTASAAFLAGALGVWAMHWMDSSTNLFAPLPVAMAAALAGCVVWLRRARADDERRANAALAVGMVGWALALLGKIVLNARIWHYGFALAMPATLLAVATAVGWAPAWVKSRGGDGAVFRAAAFGALAVVTAEYLSLAARLMAIQSHTAGVGPDRFRTDGRGRAVAEVAAVLAQQSAPGETLAVVPEGAMLNVLARRQNPTPYWSFMPPYSFFAPGAGEEAARQQTIDALAAHPPDWIALVDADRSDFCEKFFGTGYPRRPEAFARRGYQEVLVEEVRLTDPAVETFTVLLLRRTPASLPQNAGNSPSR